MGVERGTNEYGCRKSQGKKKLGAESKARTQNFRVALQCKGMKIRRRGVKNVWMNGEIEQRFQDSSTHTHGEVTR